MNETGKKGKKMTGVEGGGSSSHPSKGGASGDSLLLTEELVHKSENFFYLKEVLDAACQTVQEFHEYGAVLQQGERDDYGPDSAIGRLQLSLETMGHTFAYPVERSEEP